MFHCWTQEPWLEASRSLVKTGCVEVVALTLGHRGALLVTQDSAFRAYAPDVQVVSAVGAGDSFLVRWYGISLLAPASPKCFAMEWPPARPRS